jgi:integrase
VFRRPDGMPYEPLRDDPNDTSAGDRIKKAFAGACKRAGIKERFTPHDCRHTWATWHYAKNRDLLALQKLGGWKTVAMVARYAHVNVGEFAHTIDALPWQDCPTGGKLGDTTSAEAKTG